MGLEESKESVNMENQRPFAFFEYSESQLPWEHLGMRIKWTQPPVPGESEIAMMDPLELRVCVECKKPVRIRDLTAAAWTSCFHKENTEGVFSEIKLNYDENSRKWDENGQTTYEFHTTIYPTHNDVFPLTFNVRYRLRMLWTSHFRDDHILIVRPSRELNMWTKKEDHTQITSKFYMGNFPAVLCAEEMGYDAVLALHKIPGASKAEMPKVKTFTSAEIDPGAGFVLPDAVVSKIVSWLTKARAKHDKILVGDHDGQGRIGTAMTAYVYANNPNLSFKEAYDFVKSRKFCYCHQGLADSLARLYPRD